LLVVPLATMQPVANVLGVSQNAQFAIHQQTVHFAIMDTLIKMEFARTQPLIIAQITALFV